MAFQVLIRNSDGQVLRYEFDKDTVYLGRLEGNDIRLPQPFVSGLHLMIQREGGGYAVKDLGSTEGTMLRGIRLEPHAPERLVFGEVLSIGPLQMVLEPGEDDTVVEVIPGEVLGEDDAPGDGARAASGGDDDIVDAEIYGASGELETPAEPAEKEKEAGEPRGMPWSLIFQIVGFAVIFAGLVVFTVIVLM